MLLRPLACVTLTLGLLACPGGAQRTPSGPAGGPPVDGDLLPYREHTVPSAVLHEDRIIRVVSPPGAGMGRARYPTLYVLDGEANLTAVATAARHLAAFSSIPETIVVAVHNTQREADLNPPGVARSLPGGAAPRGDRFLAFLRDELIPFVEGSYPTNGLSILLGHSQGGLFAAYAMTQGTNPFDWVLALDAPMDVPVFEPVAAAFETRVARGADGRLYSGVATFGWSDDQWERLHSGQGGLAWSHQEDIRNESHQSMVLAGALAGLRGLFWDYPEAPAHPQTAAEIDSVFLTLSRTYGGAMSPPLSYWRRTASDLLLLRHGTEALRVIEEATKWYGDSDTLSELRARAEAIAAEGEADGDQQSTLRDLLALPPAGPESLRPFVGRWAGTAVHEGGVPNQVMLELLEVGSEVQVSLDMRIGEMGGPLDVEYLQVTDEGVLEFGYLNQRRPGGLIVSMMRLVGEGRMEGVQEVRGVDLEAMFGPGRRPAVTRVTLERVSGG